MGLMALSKRHNTSPTGSPAWVPEPVLAQPSRLMACRGHLPFTMLHLSRHLSWHSHPQGGISDEISLSAYITAALLELGQALTVRTSPAFLEQELLGAGGELVEESGRFHCEKGLWLGQQENAAIKGGSRTVWGALALQGHWRDT